MEFAPYSTTFSSEAMAMRRKLPPNTLFALLEIVDALAQDPACFPHRTKPMSRDGRICLYTHPQPPLEIAFEVQGEEKKISIIHLAAPVLPSAKQLFVSYSHADQHWLGELRKWLEQLEEEQLVKIWVDTEIRAGSKWEKEIEKSLKSAKAALLLVSDNFIESKFIATKELPKLLRGAARGRVVILWFAISKITNMNPDISQYQALYDPNTPLDTLEQQARHDAWATIFERTREVLQA